MDGRVPRLQNFWMGTSTRRDQPWGFDSESLPPYKTGAYGVVSIYSDDAGSDAIN
jgi:hypothetical protein